jgi:presenilin-like A22 family membrane protease
MKHDFKIVLILTFLFILSQIVGLIFVLGSINEVLFTEEGNTIVHDDTAIGERPDISGMGSLFYVSLGIFFGTILLLILIKFKAKKVWKFWYFLAVYMTTLVCLGVYLNYYVAIILALTFALLKIYKQNVFIHNSTEILVYSGIVVLFAPLFDLIWVIALLFLISLYDMYAVWKSKHMIKLAEFTTDSKLFAGFSVGYESKKNETKVLMNLPKPNYKSEKSSYKNAILGGGDIFFSLLFTAVVMEGLIKNGYTFIGSYFISLIVVLFSTLSLFLLFLYSKKGKFYPAMPFITSGCLFGYFLVWILTMFV